MKLTIGNSYCNLSGFNQDQFLALREVLSYRISPNAQLYGKSRYASPKRYLFSKRGDFPTGLLDKVQGVLKSFKTPYTTSDTRVVPNATPGMFKLNLEKG